MLQPLPDFLLTRGKTTLQQIAFAADAVEVTTGTVYNHFKTKAEIVRAVAVSIAESVRARNAPARAVLKTGAEQIAAAGAIWELPRAARPSSCRRLI
jgi:AcrR family transcriptional regulator